MVGKGLLGQYSGFVSRAVGFVLDLLIVIAIIWVVNFAITLPLEFFLDFNVNKCTLSVSDPVQTLIEQRQFLCLTVISTQAVLSLLAGPTYFILFWSLGGQTIGQYVAGVRVVRLDGRRMNFKHSLIRYLGYFVSFLALGLGYLWVLWDDRRQGFHDKLAKTVVVYAWTARQNEFLLDRFRQRLHPKAESTRTVMSAEERRVMRFVVTSFRLHSEMNTALSALEESVRRGDFSVANVIVLVKDENGHLGLVGVSDLSIDSPSGPLAGTDFRVIRSGLEYLLDDVPVESFVMAILVRRDMERLLLGALERLNIATRVLTMETVLNALQDRSDSVLVTGNTPEAADTRR